MKLSLKNIPWKKRMIQAVWILFGMGAMVLFGAAMVKKNQKSCAGVQIEISGATQHMFMDEKEILEVLNLSGKLKGTTTGKINLRALERLLEKNSWIQNAEMYFDNNQMLQVKVLERQPIARVFVSGGNSFYVDSAALRLPLSDKLSVRVPVFTNFPSSKSILAKPDSSLLEGIVKLASFIQTDSFWMAQIAQVNINPHSKFELVPLIGDQLIIIGDAEQLDKKFNRLKAFYQQALLQQGINTYEKLDLRFENQVVAVRRGTEKAQIDSAEAKRTLMELVAKTGPLTLPNVDTSSIYNKKITHQINNKAINKPLTNGHVSNKPKSVH
jgi:cell division protein FtsQ